MSSAGPMVWITFNNLRRFPQLMSCFVTTIAPVFGICHRMPKVHWQNSQAVTDSPKDFAELFRKAFGRHLTSDERRHLYLSSIVLDHDADNGKRNCCISVLAFSKDEKKDDRARSEPRLPHPRREEDSWLRRNLERRKPENGFIRRWFDLADIVIGHKDDSDKPEE
jgi:hypothetical protein